MTGRESFRNINAPAVCRLERMLDSDRYPSIVVSDQGLILTANMKFIDACGYSESDLIQKRKWSDFIYNGADLVDIAFRRIIKNADMRGTKDVTGYLFIDRFGNINSLRLRVGRLKEQNAIYVTFMIGGGVAAESCDSSWFNLNQVTTSIVQSMMSRDAKLVAHHIEVSTLSHSICTALKLSEEECRLVYCGSMLHDIGKISVCGAAQTSRDEDAEHCISGYNILKNINCLESVPLLVLQHHDLVSTKCSHESILGSNVEFSLLSQIIAVSEAVIENRESSYIGKISPTFFNREMPECFDREIINACRSCLMY